MTATDSLYASLVKAIADINNPSKNSTNPHFRSSYADLSSVLGVVRPALAAHGLALIQWVTARQDEGEPDHDDMVLRTRIIHTSGDYLDMGAYPIRPTKRDPQGYGSALTYARRYSIMAICLCAAEDDDGNAASAPAKPQRKRKPLAKTPSGDIDYGVIPDLDNAPLPSEFAAEVATLDDPAMIRKRFAAYRSGWKSAELKEATEIAKSRVAEIEEAAAVAAERE